MDERRRRKKKKREKKKETSVVLSEGTRTTFFPSQSPILLLLGVESASRYGAHFTPSTFDLALITLEGSKTSIKEKTVDCFHKRVL